MDKWAVMYENVCGSRRLLEGNIAAHQEFVIELARLVKVGDRVLEVGAGTGVLGWPLAQSGIEVISLDNDPEVIRMAKLNCDLLGAEIDFKEGDAFEIPFDDNSFAMAFSQGFLEHFNDNAIHEALAEQLRVAKVVVVSVPLAGIWGVKMDGERELTEEEWLSIFGRYGIVGAGRYANDAHLRVTMVRGKPDVEAG